MTERERDKEGEREGEKEIRGREGERDQGRGREGGGKGGWERERICTLPACHGVRLAHCNSQHAPRPLPARLPRPPFPSVGQRGSDQVLQSLRLLRFHRKMFQSLAPPGPHQPLHACRPTLPPKMPPSIRHNKRARQLDRHHPHYPRRRPGHIPCTPVPTCPAAILRFLARPHAAAACAPLGSRSPDARSRHASEHSGR